MSEGQPTDQSASEPIGEKAWKKAMNPRSLANLAPKWLPGQSGNPIGLTKDGRPTKSAPVAKALLERLEGKPTVRMVDRWVRDAVDHKDGHVRAKARAQILERLYPVVEDHADAKQALEAIRLELGPGQASVTLLRGLQAQKLESSSSGDGQAEGPSPAG